MKKFLRIFKLTNDKAKKIKLETDLVNQYKEAISGLFRTVSFEMDSQKNKNSFYYFDLISNFSNSLTKEYQSNTALNTIEEIELFNRMAIDLLKDIVQFFIAIDAYDSRKNKTKELIILSKTNIEDGFKNLGQFDLKIKGAFSTKDASIEAKEYCLKVIKQSFYMLNNSIYIDIEKCPFQSDFNKLIQKLEHSTSNLNDENGINSNSKKRKSKINDDRDFIDFTKTLKKPKTDKISEKWYALLYCFELKVSGKAPPKGSEGTFDKKEIEKIGALKSNKSGQYFYKIFKEIDINNQTLLNNMFGKDWKEKVIKLSNNNANIVKYINENYT
jgi:hypothetical protein